MTASKLPAKKDVALALLEESSVFLHIDPRAMDVQVPHWLKKQPQLVLQLGLNMAVNIPDLELDDEALSCTLSFNRSPHFCYLPWDAIYALVGEDGRGMVWPEDVPVEVAAQAAPGGIGQHSNRSGPLRSIPSIKDSRVESAEAKLAAAPEYSTDDSTAELAEVSEASAPAQEERAEAGSRSRRSAADRAPHLRLVK